MTGPASSSPGQALSDHLIQVHGMYRRQLTALRTAMASYTAGDGDSPPARSAVQSAAAQLGESGILAHCLVFCQALGAHHEFEDTQMFPALRRLGADAGVVIDRLSAEHQQVSRLLERLSTLARQSAENASAMGDTAIELTRLGAELESHLAYEEASLAPLFDRLMS